MWKIKYDINLIHYYGNEELMFISFIYIEMGSPKEHLRVAPETKKFRNLLKFCIFLHKCDLKYL